MTNTNVQTEELLDKLAAQCCEKLSGGNPEVGDKSEALLKSLLMNGFARRDGAPLQVELENRVKSLCQDPAMHRGGALSSISAQIQQKFDELVRWESKQPEPRAEPKTANISSATES